MRERTTGPLRGRRVAATALLLVAALTATSPARAADPGEAEGPTGQKLTVSDTSNIDPAGQKVTVTGSGYALDKGVYLAVCVIPKAGEAPSPCLGGADMSGASGSSYWISNNPPDYAKDLVKPFTVKDGKGSFRFDLTLKVKDSGADCRQKACAVVTRADHTHGGDREQDVIVPITFGSGGGTPNPEVPPGTVRHAEARQITPPVGGAIDAETDPAKGRLYVSSTDGAGSRLTTYDTKTGKVIGKPVALPVSTTGMALDSADSNILHLALGDRIAGFNTGTGKLTGYRTPALGGPVAQLAADPAADRLYVSIPQNKTVAVYDTGTWQTVGAPVELPFMQGGLSVDTKRHKGYATYVGGAMVDGKLVYRNVLNEIDGGSGELTGSVSLGDTALGVKGVTVDPKTGTGYVAAIAGGVVFTVDLKGKKVTGSLPVGGNPKGLAFDSGTGLLYAAQTTAGTVAVVDPKRKKVVETLETGDGPEDLALDDRKHTLFTVTSGTGKVVQTQRQVSPTVGKAPKPATVRAGKKAAFSASATSSPAPDTSWEVSTDGGKTWQPVADATGTKLSFKANEDHDGNRYRAVFSNPVGSTRSPAAKLTVIGSSASGGTSGSGGGQTTGGSGTAGSNGSGAGGSTTGGGGDAGATGGTGGATGGAAGSADSGSDLGGSLASTGTSTLSLAAAAAALTALGTAAVLLRRRIRA